MGKKYILTVVDYATRYPEAVALRDIHTETVAGALLQIFYRVGFPQEILSDQGTQFTAEVTQQLWRLCGIKPLYSSPYHPQTNGLCEWFNGTLKQLLRTFTMSHKDWERHLPHLLFAYREVPQEATGFSPFELLYGRRVRDHLQGPDQKEKHMHRLLLCNPPRLPAPVGARLPRYVRRRRFMSPGLPDCPQRGEEATAHARQAGSAQLLQHRP
uniref:Integrase catalytic domain-containing protein n=1 Tax=Leptobrachium leishanense TaxID=445787 RepID=A0A8C5MQV2_9ANUR